MAKIAMLSPESTHKIINQDLGVLIDVRSVGEVIAEQIPKSVFLPFDLVSKQRLDDLGLQKRIPVIVCRSGARAKQVAKALAKEVEEVAVLDGGLENWRNEGYEVQTGTKAIPLERQVLVGAGTMISLFTLLGLLISPYFFTLTFFMTMGMVFAGVTGACGMAKILTMMPWNKAPLCGNACLREVEMQENS